MQIESSSYPILLADSGSTKTDWCLIQNGEAVLQLQTAGINPVYQAPEEITQLITDSLLPALTDYSLQSVHFYGAGCATPALTETVRSILQRTIGLKGIVEVCSDMIGAARSLLGHQPGIACILGTGSNSCFWDGDHMVYNVSPLGFILGDEGSGACLGKQLVSDLLKGQTPHYLRETFLTHFGLTVADIIDHVYRRPFPNRFLASLSPFIAEHLDEPCMKRIVLDSFHAFIRRNVMQYSHCMEYPVCFTGSIAWHYRDLLAEASKDSGILLGTITASPMEGLVKFHSF